MRNACAVIVVAAALAAFPSRGGAEPVHPGGGAYVEEQPRPIVLPPGTKLAERVLPFMLEFPVPPGREAAGEMTADATLTNSVYRDPGGRLFFVYDVDVEEILFFPPDGRGVPTRELSEFTVAGFRGFATDVIGAHGSGGFDVGRSADGATLRTVRGEGLGDPPLLVVRTDATDFGAGGDATYRAGAEFLLRDAGDDGWDQTRIHSTVADLPGTFRPVPEPAAGGVALALAGGFALRRRRGLCASCGDDLRASPGRCPECRTRG